MSHKTIINMGNSDKNITTNASTCNDGEDAVNKNVDIGIR